MSKEALCGVKFQGRECRPDSASNDHAKWSLISSSDFLIIHMAIVSNAVAIQCEVS